MLRDASILNSGTSGAIDPVVVTMVHTCLCCALPLCELLNAPTPCSCFGRIHACLPLCVHRRLGVEPSVLATLPFTTQHCVSAIAGTFRLRQSQPSISQVAIVQPKRERERERERERKREREREREVDTHTQTHTDTHTHTHIHCVLA